MWFKTRAEAETQRLAWEAELGVPPRGRPIGSGEIREKVGEPVRGVYWDARRRYWVARCGPKRRFFADVGAANAARREYESTST